MTTEAERQYANVIPPFASNNPGEGVSAFAVTTTQYAVDLSLNPGTRQSLMGRYIELQADGGDVYFSFSSDGLPTILETTTGTTLAGATTNAVPWKIPNGTTFHCRCEKLTHRWLHMKTSTGTATLRVRPSSQIRSSDK